MKTIQHRHLMMPAPLACRPALSKEPLAPLQPASPHTLLNSSPPRSICCLTELGPPPLGLVIAQSCPASPPPSIPSVRFPATSSCHRSSRGEHWCCVAPLGELSDELRQRPCLWSTVDHGVTQSIDPWTQSTDFFYYY
jgi:hypothetical protein